MRRLVWLMPLLLLAPMTPATAGLFDDDEAREQVQQLRQSMEEVRGRTEALSQRVAELSANQFDFANHVESLRAEMASLRGQVELIANVVESSSKRQQDFYVDLDNRLRKLEEANKATQPAEGAEADSQNTMLDYEAALGLFREKKFPEAQAAFEAFAVGHANSAMRPNAQYWLASSLHQQKMYADAAKAFAQVVELWPDHAKAPDALLAQANALVGAKEVDAAVSALQTLIDKYPDSPAAETARARIKTLAPTRKR